jgi:hypothetical protein
MEDIMTRSLGTWAFPLVLGMVWTLTSGYALALAGSAF